jgi:5'-nucleotidase
MQILLTNDDGIFAPGLSAIYPHLKKMGDVTVAAPADVKSGAGHSITIHQPLECEEVDVNGLFKGYSVKGSPADCVKLALMELTKKPIDIVISGINDGANVGVNVYYSGTVAAAMEAAFYNIPSVALSLAMEETPDFTSAAKYCVETLKKLLPVNPGDVMNVNIPRLSMGKPKSVKVVPQSTQGFHDHYIRRKSEQGQIVYMLAGGKHNDEQANEITDTIALYDGYITVTALHYDMTDHQRTNKLKLIKW